MASIQKYTTNSKGTLYRVTIYLGLDANGRQVQKKKSGFKTKKEATLWANRFELEAGKQSLESFISTQTVKGAYEDWLKVHSTQIKAATCCNYRSMFDNHILPILGHIKLTKLNSYHCQLLVDKLVETRPNSFEVVYEAFKTFINYLYKMEYITKKHTDKVIAPKIAKDKKINFWTKEELNEFLLFAKDNLKEQFYVAYHTLAYTGMRIGELCALTWQDIDFNANTIKITKTVTRDNEGKHIIGSTKTEQSKADLFIDDQTVKILKSWKASIFVLGEFKETDLVFMTPNKTLFYTTIVSAFRSHIKKAGSKKITLHGLRHTHASLLFEMGMDLKEVSERLRHADTTITANVYVHLTDKQKQETAEAFAKYVSIS